MITRDETSSILDLLRDVNAKFRGSLPGLLLLMVVVALTDGAGMAMLLPLLSTVGIGGIEQEGPVHLTIQRLLDFTGVSGSVYGVLALVLFAFSVQAILFIWQTWWVATLQRGYAARWQRDLTQAVICAQWGFIIEHKLGELVSAITAETGRLAGAFYSLAQLVVTSVVTLVYLGIAFALSWKITVLLIGSAMMLFGALRGIGRRNARIGQEAGPLQRRFSVLLTEYIGGSKVIKTTVTEDRVLTEIGEVIDGIRENYRWASFLPGLVRGIFEFSAIVLLCLTLVVGRTQLAEATAPTLLILALFMRLVPRFNAIQQSVQSLHSYLPALRFLRTLLDKAVSAREELRQDAALAAPRGELRVVVSQAGYGASTVLRDINIVFPEKGFFGVVGDSGTGKSTLVHLMLGLCTIQEGTVSIGGRGFDSLPPGNWRQAFGFVPQETVLFHRSIAENIAWATPMASRQAIIEAAIKANADEFIKSLPDSYDTIVGDQGVRLSGGQRQRLAIARALMTKPQFLLLDEATSALDSTSEAAILEILNRLREEMCIISVAHRLASVRSADFIIVFGAETIEQGQWQDLIDRRGRFWRLAQAQGLLQPGSG
jgi:ATP-binding cassette subfamily C protein